MAKKASKRAHGDWHRVSRVELSRADDTDVLAADASQGQTFLFNLFNKNGRSKLRLRLGERSVVIHRRADDLTVEFE